jgi:hypothetical protein
VAEDPEQHQGDRPGQVQGPAGGGQDRVGVVEVGVDIGGGPLRAAGQQGPGVGQDHRVVVDVHDPGLGGDPLGHLVGVVGRRQAGADVEELADPGLAGQVADGADEELAGAAGDLDDLGEGGTELVAGVAVDRVVVLATQPVVPDPGRVRHTAIDLG